VISIRYSVCRNVAERWESLGYLVMPLKLMIFLLFFFLNTGHCAPSTVFFERHAEGWHWYESLRDGEVKEEKKENQQPGPKSRTPSQEIEAQRKALEQKLHAAILKPTQENITVYLLLQKALMDQSEKFSNEWKKVVMTTPSLDETLIHPVDQNALPLYYAEQRHDLEKHIKALSKEYGLFFFFRENCPYCHQFAPIVKRFSEKYGWSVLAISLDKGVVGSSSLKSLIPEFSHPKRDNGIGERLGITHVPALIAIHPATKKLIPLAYGLISEGEIEARVEILTRLTKYAPKESP
jgi:conjugal transfer pilus assembly protein TraF